MNFFRRKIKKTRRIRKSEENENQKLETFKLMRSERTGMVLIAALRRLCFAQSIQLATSDIVVESTTLIIRLNLRGMPL